MIIVSRADLSCSTMTFICRGELEADCNAQSEKDKDVRNADKETNLNVYVFLQLPSNLHGPH